MFSLVTQDRKPGARAKVRKAQPTLEGLEDRMLLYSVTGGHWSLPARVTYSFVPDGTSVGGISSSLFSTLNAVTSTATWQQAFQKAASVWSAVANINIAQVTDDGSAFGVGGNQQDDPRFGDIRIAAIPQSSGYLAFATLPPPINGGPNAGDIVFNSTTSWGVLTNYDIQTVAIHEFGHALGMDHSAISNADMYAYYNGFKQSLTADDVAGIQSVYGAYPADSVNNGGFTTATNVTGLIDANGQVALANQNIAGTSDLDYYVVTAPTNTTSTMTVTMQSSNLSSLAPWVAVYNSSKVGIGQAKLVNTFGGTATYTVTGVTAGQTYYIRASAASSPGAYGAFGLLVNFGSQAQAPIAPPNTVVGQKADGGGGSLGEGSGTSSVSPGLISRIVQVGRVVLTDPLGLEIVHFGNLSAYADRLEVSSIRTMHHQAAPTGVRPHLKAHQGTAEPLNGTPVAPWTASATQHYVAGHAATHTSPTRHPKAGPFAFGSRFGHRQTR